MVNMFNFTSLSSDPGRLNEIYKETPNVITDEEFIINEIREFKMSPERQEMIDGEQYYEGNQAILKKQRTVIGEDGDLQIVENLPNNLIVDNQYKKMVDQKNNYLFGKNIVISPQSEVDNKSDKELPYTTELKKLFGKRFQRLLKNIGQDSINCGIGWMYVNYDDHGELKMKRIKPYQVIPLWSDFEHDELDGLIYFYPYQIGDKTFEKVEVYDENGIHYFTLEDETLTPEEVPHRNYFELNGEGFNWLKTPWFGFKFNNKQIPLIRDVKSLQDGINHIVSTFKDNMDEDYRNSIIVLVNYDGENLGEFRRNLSEYGAVKVRADATTGNGDVKTLQVEVNAQNYEVILKMFKNALIENAKGYDAKDDRLSGEPNQMNIQSMYSDIDLDADEMETEYQAAFEELLELVNWHLGEEDELVDVVFNRNVLINETEIIGNLRDSVGILSNRTILENHPYVTDVEQERTQLEAERQEELDHLDPYDNMFDRNDVIVDGEENK